MAAWFVGLDAELVTNSLFEFELVSTVSCLSVKSEEPMESWSAVEWLVWS